MLRSPETPPDGRFFSPPKTLIFVMLPRKWLIAVASPLSFSVILFFCVICDPHSNFFRSRLTCSFGPSLPPFTASMPIL